MLPFWARVDLGTMEMKGYSAFPKVLTSPSDCLVLYLGHSLWGSYPSARKRSEYSTAPADWATGNVILVEALPSKRGKEEEKDFNS